MIIGLSNNGKDIRAGRIDSSIFENRQPVITCDTWQETELLQIDLYGHYGTASTATAGAILVLNLRYPVHFWDMCANFLLK